MSKRVLVTGGMGFIGSNLVQRFLEEGHNVTVVDNMSSGEIAFLPKGFNDYMVHDFASNHVTALVKDQKFDVIMHLAAKPRVQYSIDNPFDSNDTNVSKTLKLLEASAGNVGRFVNTSSSSVYGNAKTIPTPEHAPHQPQSPYALQKSISESYCKLFSEMFGMDTVSVRPFNVFGPHSRGDSAYATAVASWFGAVKAGRPLRSDGTGEQSRDVTYVDNVVDIMHRCATHPKKFSGDAFNAGTGSVITNNEILQWFRRNYPDCQVANAPERLNDVFRTCADLTRSSVILGYTPVVDFWNGLEKMQKWVFENE